MEIFILIVALIFIFVSVLGSFVPVIPGPPLGFIGLLLGYFVKHGEVFSIKALIILGVLTILSIILDYALPILGAKISGASKYGIWGSVIGMIIGFIALPPIGAIAGVFVGAFVGELVFNGQDARRALKSGLATFLGTVTSTFLKFSLSIAMAIYFFINLF